MDDIEKLLIIIIAAILLIGLGMAYEEAEKPIYPHYEINR